MTRKAAKAGIIGAVIGAVAGVFMLAPKGAKQNRARVKKVASKTLSDTEKRLKLAYKDLNQQAKAWRAKAAKLKGPAKAKAETAEKRVQELLDQTKSLITSVREGDEEVYDQVKVVIGEVKKLKTTLGKKVKGIPGGGRNKAK